MQLRRRGASLLLVAATQPDWREVTGPKPTHHLLSAQGPYPQFPLSLKHTSPHPWLVRDAHWFSQLMVKSYVLVFVPD